MAHSYSTFESLMQASAAAFLSADVNRDQRLDFDEFCRIVPEHTRQHHTTADMRQLFEAADVDRSGGISRDEFFFWTISWTEQYA